MGAGEGYPLQGGGYALYGHLIYFITVRFDFDLIIDWEDHTRRFATQLQSWCGLQLEHNTWLYCTLGNCGLTVGLSIVYSNGPAE